MDGLGGLVIVALLVGLPAWALWEQRRARTRSPFRTTARTPVARAREGKLTRLVGRVRCDGPLLAAPLTGRPCALYQVTVKEDDGGAAYTIIHQECRHINAFQLDDGTGCALVRLRGGEPPPEVEPFFEAPMAFSSAWHEPAAGRLRRFIEERGLTARSSSSFLQPSRLLFEEGIVGEGDTVAVVGLARFELDRAGVAGPQPYRDAAHLATLQAPPGTALLISTEVWAR
jgi:hypothetical protein